ncbi:MAG: beta-galactosidase, partial [Bacteroidales bacterium]|nr:beta-galactosidase [Bacteroidales bacterium]
MYKGIKFFMAAFLIAATTSSGAQTISRLENGWKFAFGNASDPGKDWGRGTEYFNYLTKAHSIHNQGPYTETFDDSAWEDITVPHDWVPALPCDSLASHSHGYKTVGWKYPETSVGWYRKALSFKKAQEGHHFTIKFDGIFRDATVWFNGIFMGSEPSGYATQVYDITPYIDFNGGPNVLTVRADATLEEGWFYEGAGIYRNAYLIETNGPYIPDGSFWASWDGTKVTIHSDVPSATHRILDADGKEMTEPHLWTPEDPYLYTLESTVGEDVYRTAIGLRTVEFNAQDGFLLNGKKFILKGVNLHQDHAGVGAAMPDELIEWRVKQLKKLGVNAIRCSHNPASPALLDICDREGILLIDENRLMGVNSHHRHLLKNMVLEGRSHPSVILWSVGNEEWGLENDVRGIKIVKEMQEYVRSLDPTRQTTAANAGGGTLIEGLEVHGYNYIRQNDVDGRHARHPEWIIYGSEETTGCGTRGIYEAQEGRMPALNRTEGYGTVSGLNNSPK